MKERAQQARVRREVCYEGVPMGLGDFYYDRRERYGVLALVYLSVAIT